MSVYDALAGPFDTVAGLPERLNSGDADPFTSEPSPIERKENCRIDPAKGL